MNNQSESDGMFARKLNRLFRTKRKPDGTEYSAAEVEVGTVQLGERVTHTYVYRLRKGISQNPSYEKIKVLARFFDVPPGYFFEEEEEHTTATSDSSPSAHLDLQDIALRAEEIKDEAAKDAVLKMLAAIQQVRDQSQKKK